MSVPLPELRLPQELNKPVPQGRCRGNAVARLASVALLAVCLLAASGGWQPSKPRSVEAENFILRDASGRVRGRLTMAQDGPGFSLLDEKGMVRLSLTINRFGAGVNLSDVEGSLRASLAVLNDGSFEMVMTDAAGKPRGQIRCDQDVTRLGLLPPEGNASVWLAAASDLTGITCFDADGNKRGMLAVNPDGVALGLHDQQGRARLISSCFNKQGPDLRILDEAGQPRFAQPE